MVVRVLSNRIPSRERFSLSLNRKRILITQQSTSSIITVEVKRLIRPVKQNDESGTAGV